MKKTLLFCLFFLTGINLNAAEFKPTPDITAQSNHNLLREENLKLLGELAQLFFKQFNAIKDTRPQTIILLGQSPAWLGKVMQKIDKEERKYINIAFSGSDKKTPYTEQAHIDAYKNFLKQEITEEIRTNHQCIVIDFCYHKRGLISWNKYFGTLFSSINYVYVQSELSEMLGGTTTIQPYDKKIYLEINSPLDKLVGFLGGDDTARIVPHFPYEAWNKENPQFIPNELVSTIQQAIENFFK